MQTTVLMTVEETLAELGETVVAMRCAAAVMMALAAGERTPPPKLYRCDRRLDCIAEKWPKTLSGARIRKSDSRQVALAPHHISVKRSEFLANQDDVIAR